MGLGTVLSGAKFLFYMALFVPAVFFEKSSNIVLAAFASGFIVGDLVTWGMKLVLDFLDSALDESWFTVVTVCIALYVLRTYSPVIPEEEGMLWVAVATGMIVATVKTVSYVFCEFLGMVGD